MAITDELRAWAHGPDEGDDWLDRIDEFCDRIDAAHRSALEKLAAQLDETSDMRDFIGRIEQAVTNREDVTLWGVDYAPLPVDADGVPIHVGDDLDGLHYEGGTVTGIQYGLAASGTISELVAVRPHGWDTATWHDPEEYRHHHAPTVEDVLREFALACEDAGNAGPEVARIAAEYAAKLRLAEEVDA